MVVTSLTALASGQLLCKVPGEIVEGDFNKLTRVKNYNSCLNECKNAKTCFWFTFLGDVTDADGNYDCFLFETKGTIEESCSNCFSGQKDCLVGKEQHVIPFKECSLRHQSKVWKLLAA